MSAEKLLKKLPPNENADPNAIELGFNEENVLEGVPGVVQVNSTNYNGRSTPASDPGLASFRSTASLLPKPTIIKPAAVPTNKALPAQPVAKPSLFQRLFKGNTFENLKSLGKQTVRKSLLNAYNSGDAKTVERIRKFLGKKDPLIQEKILETIGFLETQGRSTNQKKVKKYEQLLTALGESVINVNTYWNGEGGKRRNRRTRKQKKSRKTRKTRQTRK